MSHYKLQRRMDIELQLSENLYPTDEVIGSLVQCQLTRKPLHECLYWLWELLASTPNVAEGMTVIYRMFYASSSSNLGRYVSRKIDVFMETGDKRSLADIVANLRTSKYTGTAYLINRYGERESASVIYRKQSWMNDYPDKSHQILGALKARDLENIGWHCKIHTEHNGIDSTKTIIKQYANSLGVDVNDGIDSAYDTNDCLQISAMLARIFDHPPLQVRNRFVRTPIDMVNDMEIHFTRKSTKYWRKLSERRLYPTHSVMPPGNYGRHQVESLQKASQLHWEYYCYESILWKRRFDQYGAFRDNDKKEIAFPNDDCLENFYDDDNCMDFDEQPAEVQLMSLHEINIIEDPLIWLNLVKSAELENSMETMTL